MQKTAGIRDLVSLNRELELQARGEPFNELVVGHADMLKQSPSQNSRRRPRSRTLCRNRFRPFPVYGIVVVTTGDG